VTQQLTLSTFTGVGLLDRAFREAGFVVVSAGDLIYGQDIRNFKGIKSRFDGVFGGPPCQPFSDANRDRPVGENHYGFQMIDEFKRIVKECDPTWYLFENVRNSPNFFIEGYEHQRIDINQGWYSDVNRLRHIQFGHKEGKKIQWERGTVTDRSLKSCALASDNRSFRELCTLQGLENDFDLPDFTVKGKKKLVGNGVPLIMGRVIANAVRDCTGLNNCDLAAENNCDFAADINCDSTGQIKCDSPANKNYCECGCGRTVTGRAKTYDATCRKRKSRRILL
jgi:DNA (cytosine-5)-methyltransferase 1